MAAAVKGTQDVLRRLNSELAGIAGRSMGGLLAGGLKVQALSQRRVPIEYGNLRASAYTRKAANIGTAGGAVARGIIGGLATEPLAVEVGYSASYALFVHENMQQKLKGQRRPSGLGVYWGPAGQPKYLESAVVELAGSGELVRTVADHARMRSGAA